MMTLDDHHWRATVSDLEGWTSFSYPNDAKILPPHLHREQFYDMIGWIKTNVERYQQNALWTYINDHIYIMIRRREDATVFALKFGI